MHPDGGPLLGHFLSLVLCLAGWARSPLADVMHVCVWGREVWSPGCLWLCSTVPSMSPMRVSGRPRRQVMVEGAGSPGQEWPAPSSPPLGLAFLSCFIQSDSQLLSLPTVPLGRHFMSLSRRLNSDARGRRKLRS